MTVTSLNTNFTGKLPIKYPLSRCDNLSNNSKTPLSENNRNTKSSLDLPAYAFKHLTYKPEIKTNQKLSFGSSIVEKQLTYEDLIAFLKTIDSNEDKSVEKILKSALIDGKVLGVGKAHRVYSIPETNDFVIRTAKSQSVCLGKIKPDHILFKNINLGQPIAYISTYGGIGAQFLRKVEGESIGVPYDIKQAARKQLINKNEELLGEDLFLNNLKEISSLPQYTFDDLASDIKILRDGGYVFDIANPNNILLHKDSNTGKFKFNIIDDLIKMDDIEDMYQGKGWYGTLEDLAIPLMDFSANSFYSENSSNLKNNDNLKQKVENCNKTILEKCIIASLKADLPKPKNDLRIIELFKMSGLEKDDWIEISQNWNKLKSDIISDNLVKVF